jgi:hypothetical protein
VYSASQVPGRVPSQRRFCGSFPEMAKFKRVSFYSKGRTFFRQNREHFNEFEVRAWV